MKLKRHRIEGIDFQRARWTGKKITPELVVLHDTASRLEHGNAARYLQNNEVKVSVHFVIERDGTVVQQVPTNLRANHAGRSHYHGMKHVNNFSVGIEIVNVGWMTALNDEKAMTWFKQRYSRHSLEDGFDVAEVTTPEHGAGLWMDYTDAQIGSVITLLQALFEGIPTLKDIRGHWYVSPGRKVDPNPLFPMEQVRSLILGREEPVEEEADVAADLEVEQGDFTYIQVPGGRLNMRRWPSFNPNVITSIPHGTVVPVVKQGLFDGALWFKVFFDGQEGWVLGDYVTANPRS